MDLRTAKTLSPREYHARRDAARRAERELATAVDLRPLRGPSPKRSKTRERESMDERRLVLERRIRKDLELLEKLWQGLEAVDLAAPEIDEKDLAFTGYRLHNLYRAAENIFRNIAETFGNHA